MNDAHDTTTETLSLEADPAMHTATGPTFRHSQAMRELPRCLPLALLAVVLVTSLVQAQDKYPSAAELPSRAELPDPLVALDGHRIATADEWNAQRRPELKKLIQHYMYGFLPPAPAKVLGKVEHADKSYFGGKATRKLVTVSWGGPEMPVINLLLVTPNQRSRPAPVFVGVNFCGNHTLVNDPLVPLPKGWIYKSCPGCANEVATEEGRGKQIDVWNLEMAIDRGYAVATFYSGDIDPDKPDFTDGVHPHYWKPGQKQPGPDDWGTIAAWSWGIHRAIDYLVSDRDLDSKRIAVVGHSRLGKTSLLAAALDDRIALAIPHQAGCGGTAPSRGKVGESVKQINDRFPHWFCDEFTQFNDDPTRLPFDQNALVALCAPRPVLFSNAVEDTWANPDGQLEVLKAANGAYQLLGAGGIDPQARPEVGRLIDSRLGYFLRGGKHSMNAEDWKAFLDFADKQFGPAKN